VNDFTEELFIAISQNDLEGVKECLAKGADINAIDQDRDVLSAAIAWPREKNSQIIEHLIEAGASPNNLGADGTTALYCASGSKDEKLVSRLISIGSNAESEKPEDGHSSLHAAAEEGNAEIIKLLLEAGGKSKLNTFDYIAETPLMKAVKKNSFEVARLLIDAVADVNANDEDRIGDTALKEAVYKGEVKMVKLLLEANADPTIEGWMRVTPLLRAQIVENKSEDSNEILRLLLEKLESSNI
jgi:ankyrin repeat protein